MSDTNLKKRICWITPDYFLDVDACIVPNLSDDYHIKWIIINTKNTKRKSDGLISDKFVPEEIQLQYRQKDPRIIFQYIKLLLAVRKWRYDLVYISFHGLPFFFPVFFSLIDAKKVIYGIHNVSTPRGASNEKWMRLYHWYAFRKIKNFQVFSNYQMEVIKKLLPNKKHYYAPLALKDYGTSIVEPPANTIRFLFFGYIRAYKRLDLLLNSFQDLYHSGIKNIELYIAGDCENWELYQAMITAKEAIRCRIEIIPNNEIPDIMSGCHYLVLPYQDGAQSGVIAAAYQYNKPAIASNIPAFRQFITDQKTGYLFETESQADLTNVLKSVISNHSANYQTMQANLIDFVKKEYSLETILSMYKKFLNECMGSAG